MWNEGDPLYMIKLNEDALNEARWVACNAGYTDDDGEYPPTSMEYATKLADVAIEAYIAACHLEQL